MILALKAPTIIHHCTGVVILCVGQRLFRITQNSLRDWQSCSELKVYCAGTNSKIRVEEYLTPLLHPLENATPHRVEIPAIGVWVGCIIRFIVPKSLQHLEILVPHPRFMYGTSYLAKLNMCSFICPC